MIDDITHLNTSQNEIPQGENIFGKVKKKEGNRIYIEFHALYRTDPDSKYIIVLDNEIDDVITCPLNDNGVITKDIANWKFVDGKYHNIIFQGINRATTPDCPYRVEVSTKSGNPVKLVALMKSYNDRNFIFVSYDTK